MDRVIFIPSALPPHKQPDNLADAEHRLKMTGDAISDDTGLSVSDIELKRTGPSYTVDTVTHFMQLSPSGSELSFILGLDAFLEIETWKSYRSLFGLIPFIVITRPGTGYPTAAENKKTIETYLRKWVSDSYRCRRNTPVFEDPDLQPVHICSVTPMDISSTAIRRQVRRGESIRSLVGGSVEEYILKKGLYR